MSYPAHSPKQIEFIGQRRKTDCGIACAGMLCGLLYGDVLAILQGLSINYKKGINLDEMFEFFDECNKSCFKVDKLPSKGQALVTIQWKDTCSGHYIVWDSKRKQFLDPLHGLVGRREMTKYASIESVWKVE
jgi:hypothetical protein